MNSAPSSIPRTRLSVAILASLLLMQSAFAFFPEPDPLILIAGQTGVVKVKGSSGGAAVVLNSVNFGTPGVATSDHSGPESGTGFVNVSITGVVPGTTSVFFSGTNNNQGVGGSITVHVLQKVVSSSGEVYFAAAGDPINTGNGEYFAQEAVDHNLGGPMPLVFARYVASSLKSDGLTVAALGDNRSHNFASHMTEPVLGMIKQVVLPNGRAVRFKKTGTKWLLMQPLDIPYVLVQSGTDFLLGHPDTKQIWTYNTNGQLTKVEDGKGNVHNLSYTATRLTGVSDGLGRTLTLTYTGSFLTKVTDQNNRETTFTYTGSVLTSASDIGGHVTTYGNSGGLPTSITRPEANVLFTQTYTGGKVTSQTERGTDTSTLVYGAGTTTFTDPTSATLVDNYTNGRLTSHVDQAGKAITMTYDAAGRRNSVTDRLGNRTLLTYHALSGQVATVTNVEGKLTTMAYKWRTFMGIPFYDLTKVTFPDGGTRAFTYDAKGNITQYTDQAGKSWKYTYNNNGQVLTSTNPLGGVSTYTYDARGNLASSQDFDTGVTTYTYDVFNRLTLVTRPGGATVIMAYDAEDRLTSVTDERGKVTTHAYDNNGRLITATDPDSNAISFGYDVLDRVAQTTDRLGKISSLTFNSRRLLDTLTDRNGNTVTLQYDTRQRPISLTDAGGEVWSIGYDDEDLPISSANPIDPPITTKLNKLGLPIESSDPLGNTDAWVRDPMQRVLFEFDPLGRQTTYTYDKRGLLTSASVQGAGSGKYDRDGLGNITKITDPNGGAWANSYNKAGRLLVTTDPLGKKWAHTYDTRGRLLTTTYPDSSTLTLAYDAANHITSRQYSAGPNLVCTYDDLGNLATVDGVTLTRDAEERLINAEQNSFDFGATYDDGGRLKTVSYRDGAVVVTYLYDTRNRLTKVSDNISGAVIDFTYDDANRLILLERSNNVDGAYAYDSAGRLTSLQEGTLIDIDYTLNAAGEITVMDAVTLPLEPAATTSAQSFKFGKASQLITPGYVYDTRGRLTANPAGDTFTWDGAGRLTNADGVTLTYNGFHDVVLRTAGPDTTRFYNHYAISLAPIVYEDVPTGSDRAYVWTPEGELLYSIDMVTMEPTFYLFDHIGSTLALTNAAGAVIDSYTYGPFGEMLDQSGTNTQPFTYIGQHGVRKEGNLYQMRKRYYDPVTARFLSRDPLPPELHDPATLNPYQYAANDPLTFIDPEGTRRRKGKKGRHHHVGPGGHLCRGRCEHEESRISKAELRRALATPTVASTFVANSLCGAPPADSPFSCVGNPPPPLWFKDGVLQSPALPAPDGPPSPSAENMVFGGAGNDTLAAPPDESAIEISNDPGTPPAESAATAAHRIHLDGVLRALYAAYRYLQAASVTNANEYFDLQRPGPSYLEDERAKKLVKNRSAGTAIKANLKAIGGLIEAFGGTVPPAPL
ncbi:MAG TPA: RHS repeat-associated core domain-containing protein [Prosthecobacter sp.]|nr:RHS repeat-associated core domain-containing protein [Prosthecobacter sp.]